MSNGTIARKPATSAGARPTKRLTDATTSRGRSAASRRASSPTSTCSPRRPAP
jgi:hypothetical protein